MKKELDQFYTDLIHQYGEPVDYWPQWCAKNKTIEERERIIIGMILVQRTSWHNANIALKNLKKEGLLSIKKIAELKEVDKLKQLIRPAGFFQSKPQCLIDLSTFIVNEGGVKELMKKDLSEIRSKLLNLKGIGPETADTIMLYALDKPVFIIDEYTRRLVVKNNLTTEKDYAKLQQYFENNLESGVKLYQNFHALIIISQRGREKSMMEVV
jgi:endonuclease III related protein